MPCGMFKCAKPGNCFIRSHSSAGQSVRLITVRSAAQARVGPDICVVRRRDHCAGLLRCGLHGPMWVARPRQTDADAVKGFAGTVQHWQLSLLLSAFPMGLIAQLVRAYGQ